MRLFQVVLIGFVILLVVSCSSKKMRKNCEKVDSTYFLCEDL